METRKRDHRRFQENLVHFSKPLIDRARMVLRGRPDMDVEQFLKEFEDFLNPKDKAGTKVIHRKARHKRSAEKEISMLSEGLTQVSLMERSREEEEGQDFIPSIATGSSHIAPPHELLGNLPTNPSTFSNDHTVSFSEGANIDHLSITQEMSSKLRSLTLSSLDSTDGTQSDLLGPDRENTNLSTNPSKSRRPSSEREGSFHLPAIVATKSDVMNLKSRPGSSADVSTTEQTLEQQPHGETLKLKGNHESSSDTGNGPSVRIVDLNNNECSNSNKTFKSEINPEYYNNVNQDILDGKKNAKGIISGSLDSPTGNGLASLKKSGQSVKSIPGETQRLECPPSVLKEKNQHMPKNVPQSSNGQRSNLSSHEENNRSSRKSTSKSAGLSSTPSTILSQIIMEEEESNERKIRDTPSTVVSTSPPYSYHTQSPQGKSGNHHPADRSDSRYIQRLPLLKTHGDAFNTKHNIATGPNDTSSDQSGTGRNQSPWRNKSEFADLFSAKKKTHPSRDSETLPPQSNISKHREAKPIEANSLMRKKDLFYASLDFDKRGNHRNTSTSNEPNNRPPQSSSRRFNPRNASNSREQSRGSPDRGFLPNLANKRGHGTGNGNDVSVSNGSNSHEDTKESNGSATGAYTLTCTIGLPKLWKQSMDKKKVAEPEVSAAAMARKHRRGRMNSHSMF